MPPALTVLPMDATRFAFSRARDVALFIEETLDQMKKGLIDHKVAQAMFAGCSVLLKALTTSELERLAAEIDSMKAAVEQHSMALEEGQGHGQTGVFSDEHNGASGDCPSLEDYEARPGDGLEDDEQPPGAGDTQGPFLDPAPGSNGASPLSASELDLWG